MKFLKKQYVFVCILLLFSCSQTLNFEQLDDYTTQPTIIIPLTFFSLNATNFVINPNNPNGTTKAVQDSDFEILENNFINTNLVRLDFNFEIRNEFDKDFTIEITLLDANDVMVYEFQDLKIKAKKLDFKQPESIDILLNSNVKNFRRVEIKILLDDKTTPIVPSEGGKLDFKSAGIFYLKTSL